MEAQATHKYIGSSPRKMRLVIDMIRGESVDKAIEILHFSTKHAARDVEKVLRSAISNLFNKDEDNKREVSELFIREAFVNQGPTLKRMLPAPMGRAYRIRKRSNHLTIVVTTKR
ncbi:50S ribosomal protein L22 [bacterium BMS3Abin04]|nr:50S ribosomal protein L22 [bacterium BMS3Abin04]